MLGEVAPEPDEAALTLFLRVVFWHFASNIELAFPPGNPAGTGSKLSRSSTQTPRFHFLRQPLWPKFWVDRPEKSVFETAALLRCCEQSDNGNLWVLRLLLHFSCCFWGDFGSRLQYRRSLSNMVESGWTDGLDLVLAKESSEDTIIESSVCIAIARSVLQNQPNSGQ